MPEGQPAASGAPSPTGAPSPSNNPATVSKADYDALLEKQSALERRFEAMERAEANRKAQAQRQRQQARGAGGADAEGVDDDGEPIRPSAAPTADQLKDPNALASHLSRQDAELQRLRQKDLQRAKEEADRERDQEIDRQVALAIPTGATPAAEATAKTRREFLKSHIELRTRKSDDGNWIHDDGRRVKPLDQAVREFAAMDVFRPSTAVPGPGTRNDGPVQALAGDPASKIDQKLPAEERIRQYRQLSPK